MSKDLEYTMCCCCACNAPIMPSVEALRKDGIGVRAVLYIASEATRNKADWNLTREDPKILDEFNGLHIFHETNTIPVMKLFQKGRGRGLWKGVDTPHFNRLNFADHHPIRVSDIRDSASDLKNGNFADNVPVPSDMICVSTVEARDFRAVTWAAPAPLAEFKPLVREIADCLNRVGSCRLTPDFDLKVPGCKSCNDIMTLAATSAHFLVRSEISTTPLVPLESILSVQLSGTLQQDNLKFEKVKGNGKFRWDPSDISRRGMPKDYTYQACLAYYIHRCMPRSREGRIQDEETKEGLHANIAAMAFLLLEIAGLIYERTNGLQGGEKRLVKAAYRYRGCIELYLSYVFWLLLRIDNIDGEEYGKDGRHCTLDFMRFHRYIFLDVLKVLVLAEPKYAGEIEITDIVFSGDMLKAGRSYSRDKSEPPAKRIGFMCDSIVVFYKNIMKPLFSRHMAGLEPDPALLPLDFRRGGEEEAIKHNKQKLTYNMLVDMESLRRVMYVIPKVIAGEIDTVIEEVGVQAVFARWQMMLELAPKSTESLVQSFVDNEVLSEYSNIRDNMRPDSFQPAISMETAEAIFMMCNALELPSEPNSREELELLRIAPKCSEMKAIERLDKVQAFREVDKRPEMQVGARIGSGLQLGSGLELDLGVVLRLYGNSAKSGNPSRFPRIQTARGCVE